MRIAWDWGMEQYDEISKAVTMLTQAGYIRRNIIIFCLVNWKISYDTCLQKLIKIKELGVKIDDCFWDTTKKQKLPLYWTTNELKDFRAKCRKHNQLINFNGYDPEIR